MKKGAAVGAVTLEGKPAGKVKLDVWPGSRLKIESMEISM